MASSSTTSQAAPCSRCASAVNVANFVPTKLLLSHQFLHNYESWKERMICLFNSQGLLEFIDGTKISEKPDDHDHNIMSSRTDQLVKGWILGALSDEVVPVVAKSGSTARDVWLNLENFFTKSEVSAPPIPPSSSPSSISQRESREDNKKDTELELYRATLSGDWSIAFSILRGDSSLVRAKIGLNSQTALHVAVGTEKHNDFVRKLVYWMHESELSALVDADGNNALHIAAMKKNTEAAQILVCRSPDLLYGRNKSGKFPIQIAVMSGHRSITDYFISVTKDDDPYFGEGGVGLLNALIDADFFDIALDVLERFPKLANGKDAFGYFALNIITRKGSAFYSGTRVNFLEHLIYSSVPLETKPFFSSVGLSAQLRRSDGLVQYLLSSPCKLLKYIVPQVKQIHDKKLMHYQALRIVEDLCNNMIMLSSPEEASRLYADVLYRAASLGIIEIIEVILWKTYRPEVLHNSQLTKSTIFELAIKNRCEKVFNLIYQTTDPKQQFSDTKDCHGNTFLHLVATLAPSLKLNIVSGAALQMQREIQWFKEVEKFVHPNLKDHENEDGLTPKMIFSKHHEVLKVEGENWMKATAESCTIVGSLIATVVFAAAITVPGGNQSETGYPMFQKSSAFIIFALSDAISLFTSTTSVLMFLSIMTSRYAEEDFLYALPKRLCIGLFTLFVSISFMMVAFSATIYLVFGSMNAWVLIPVAALACLPVTSFMLLQFPLLVDVISSTYGRGIFGKQSDLPF